MAVLVLCGVERGARPLERAVHRGDARVEQLGDLAGLPAEHLAQDEDRALLRRQALERRHEGKSDGFARDGDLGRIAAGRDRDGIGDRLDPERFLERGPERRLGDGRRAHVHRSGAPLAAIEHVEADVRRDPVQP